MDLNEEINAQQQDPNYKPSFEDLLDVITAGEIERDKFADMIG
jgi:hypothetical protein